jgi:xyloglucan-specific exo-beta-1,4-glucanase
VAGGQVAVSADGTSILWRTGTGRILVSGTTAAFTDVGSLPGGSIIAADKKDASIFYGASGSSFYISRNAGRTFSSSGTLGSQPYPYKIAVHPTVAGDVWISTNNGLFHSTDFGATFKAIPKASQAWGIALGAPPSAGGYPAIFAVANISGTGGIYRSDDTGVNLPPLWGMAFSRTSS